LAQQKARACAGCHSTTNDLPLDGGNNNFLGGPLGTLYAPNLTPGGPLKDWSDGEIARAIREGIDKNGRPLLIMPSGSFHSMSDADVQALVAALRAQKPTPHDAPSRNMGLMGTVLIGAGMFPTAVQPPLSGPVAAPPRGVTAEYGQYLVKILGCQECHGQDLAGVPPGRGGPSGPNLTVLVPKWGEADFVKTIRTGVDPAGKTLDPEQMPWKEFSNASSDDDLKAMYQYLHGLAPIQK
jgi:mono/diheme cytochrome c family protein